MQTRSYAPQPIHPLGVAVLVLLLNVLAIPALSDTIELANGEKIEATIVDDSGEVIIADHPTFGRIEIPKDQLKPPDPPKRRDLGIFGTNILKGWKRRAALGFSGASGDTDIANLNAELKIQNETEGYRANFITQYFYGSADGEKQTNKAHVGYQHDLLFKGTRWYLFGGAKYDFDEFQFWVNRIAGNGGVGFDFVKREKLTLRGEAGVGFSYEAGNSNTTNPEGVIGLIFDWAFYDGQTFHIDSTYYPNFKNTPELRWINNVAWTIDLGFIDGLSLEAGLRHEMNTEAQNKGINPANGLPYSENNVNYFGNIGYAF